MREIFQYIKSNPRKVILGAVAILGTLNVIPITLSQAIISVINLPDASLPQ